MTWIYEYCVTCGQKRWIGDNDKMCEPCWVKEDKIARGYDYGEHETKWQSAFMVMVSVKMRLKRIFFIVNII